MSQPTFDRGRPNRLQRAFFRGPVRFVTAEGKPIAEGKVVAKWSTYTEGGGSIYINSHWGSVSRPVETYKAVSWSLVPGSLKGAA